MLKFTKRPKTLGITFKKHGFFWRELAICKWLSCSSGWNKRWYASIYKEMELEMDCLTSRIPLPKVSSYKYQFCTKVCVIFKAGLSSSNDGWAKFRQKVPDMWDSNQNLETIWNSKLKFVELFSNSKDFFIKRVQKN